jgi:hypothetical protein
VAQQLTQAFPVREDALWRALRVSLPQVTTQATFWESAHSVEWSSDATPFSWGQVFKSWVEAGPGGSSILILSGKSPIRPSLGDRRRRAAVFRALVESVSEVISGPEAATAAPPTEDRVRYWNGAEWTVEPPPSAR